MGSTATGYDGDGTDPIAICGFSCKFPQQATSPDELWRVLMERKCTMTEFPSNRFNADAFRGPGKRHNTFTSRGGHFIDEDLSFFDNEFFAITPAEAAAMDPMQRLLLETTYQALENAGLPMESVSGTNTGVYTGCFTNDYLLQLCRDPECLPTYMATGIGASMLANRISWFFDLQGPSVAMDSACSSSATALDVACQALRSGSCDMCIVAGCNLTYSPEYFQMMSNMNFLSPDGRCYSFDHRANGYGRGEGIAVIVLKRFSTAVEDKQCIRAVIRATGCNEDGRTQGITQPSSEAQERLIRHTYSKAGLSMEHTRFFEAHGTGTPVGDPIEARAIGHSFSGYRSTTDPMFVGAVKSNLGHLEGASCLAGLIKATLVLESGLIPPNANFEQLNPEIDANALNLKFPDSCHPWPSCSLRRASINSFGYGGANSHIILDDAYHYMHSRGIDGNHRTRISSGSSPGLPSELSTLGQHFIPQGSAASDNLKDLSIPGLTPPDSPDTEMETDSKVLDGSECSGQALPTSEHHQQPAKILVWSTSDEKGIYRILDSYEGNTKLPSNDSFATSSLSDLAYTLDSHRSHLTWRSFAIVQSPLDMFNLPSLASIPKKSRSGMKVAFIFTGQGAQWAGMGKELMAYSQFLSSLNRATEYLSKLGCSWDVVEEMLRPPETSRLGQPQYSQTICSVLQIALVDLLENFQVRPSMVLGHSSGEIAAAYAGGYLSTESAWKLSYLRGVCSDELVHDVNSSQSRGAMMAVGLPEHQVHLLIDELNRERQTFGITIACINSPLNVTVAGEECLIDRLKIILEEKKVFSRKLVVNVAYHSQQMASAAKMYETLIGNLAVPSSSTNIGQVPMISTVTGLQVFSKDLSEASYWASNMIEPVRFSCAMRTLTQTNRIDEFGGCNNIGNIPVVDHLVEIGPSAALQGPIREILRSGLDAESIGYSSVLRRKESAFRSMLQVMGEFHCKGLRVNLRAVNEPMHVGVKGADVSGCRKLLVDLPEYPFNHSQAHWNESRLSREYRFRQPRVSQLLGVRSSDSSRSEPHWRQFMKTSDMPWTLDHVINDRVLYPAAGMLAMAIEAVRQLQEDERSIEAYALQDVDFEAPIDLTDYSTGAGLEVQTTLSPVAEPEHDGNLHYHLTIHSYSSTRNEWILNCQGTILTESSKCADDWARSKARQHRQHLADRLSSILTHSGGLEIDSKQVYDFLREHVGCHFGPCLQRIRSQRYDSALKQSAAEIQVLLNEPGNAQYTIHPATLDSLFHLALTPLTAGGSQTIATTVPTHIARLWLSNPELWDSSKPALHAGVTIDEVNERGSFCSAVAMQDQVVAWYDGLRMTNVTSNPTTELLKASSNQFCMQIQCKPSLKSLEPDGIVALLQRQHPSPPIDHNFWRDIELLCELSIEDLAMAFNEAGENADTWKSWRRHYWNWAQYHRARKSQKTRDLDPSLRQDLEDRLANANHVGRLFVTVAKSLVKIFQGDASPLDLLMQSGILKAFYEETNKHSSTLQIAAYVDLLAHQQPGLKILELGGGTGGGTRNFLRQLSAGQDNEECMNLRCARYDFTDVSHTLVNGAQAEFHRFQQQMTFGTLDIERDYTDQGFLENEYDVVIAVNVLHITCDLRATLRRVRQSLRAGGRLIFKESLSKDGWVEGFVFGLFPGWWFGSQDGRILAPSLDLASWDSVLRETGFSGCEISLELLKDTPSPGGWIVTTAVAEKPLAVPSMLVSTTQCHARIFIDYTDLSQERLARTLVDSLEMSYSMSADILDIAAVQDTPEAQIPRGQFEEELVLLLFNYGRSYLSQLDEFRWNRVKSLVNNIGRHLWVSSGGGHCPTPDHGILDGLTRTLRHEQPQRQVVHLALDSADLLETKLSHLMYVIKEMLDRKPEAYYEQEYTSVNGLLHTRRLVEASGLTTLVEKNTASFKTESIPCDGCISFERTTEPEHPEQLTQFVQTTASSRVLDAEEVEILARATLVSSHDPDMPPGTHHAGAYAGIVSRTGSSNTGFHHGDRVFAISLEQPTIRSHIVTTAVMVRKIPDNVSFVDACHLMPLEAAAVHTLFEVGQMVKSDAVLVHNAAHPLGQSMLESIIQHGVKTIWATASNQDESQMIEANFGIPPHRIVPTHWLEDATIWSSSWRGTFDLVLVTDILKSLQPHLMSFMRPHGRIVVLRTRSSACRDLQTMHSIPHNLSICMVDLGQVVPSQMALNHAAARLRIPTHRYQTQPMVFSPSNVVSALEEANRHQFWGSVMLLFDDSAMVDVLTPRQIPSFASSKGTYIIAGGFGGLGRATARWLAANGARYLILLSRSGPSSAKAREVIEELQQVGVHVEAPSCDISDKSSLKSVLISCSTRMPPVKGCVQAAMDLREALLDEMDFEDWQAALSPKVTGSWNLHACLPKDLDFFLLLSSSMGILGTKKLAGYNAGNTYQAALAKYRNYHGQPAACVDLGGVLEEGYVAEHEVSKGFFRKNKHLIPISMPQFYALLEIYCCRNGEEMAGRQRSGQDIIGLSPPAFWMHQMDHVPFTLGQPLWGHLHHLPRPVDGQVLTGGEKSSMRSHALHEAQRLASTAGSSLKDLATAVGEALKDQTSVLLGLDEKRLEADTLLSQLGIDSLSAIDLRDWIRRSFGVDVPIFKILDTGTLESIGMLVAQELHANSQI